MIEDAQFFLSNAAYQGNLELIKFFVLTSRFHEDILYSVNEIRNGAAAGGHIEILQYLIDSAPMESEILEMDDTTGETVAHHAARNDQVHVLHFIVENAPSGPMTLTIQEKYGWTPLHVAVSQDGLKSIAFIVGQLGLNALGILDNGGKTPVDFARGRTLEFIEFLKDNPPPPPPGLQELKKIRESWCDLECDRIPADDDLEYSLPCLTLQISYDQLSLASKQWWLLVEEKLSSM